MPVTFPLGFASFIDRLSIREMALPTLTEQTLSSRTRGGELLRYDVGAKLWTGRIVVSPGTRQESDLQIALIDLLREAGSSFLWYRPARIGPQADPTGTILGATIPTIGAVSADNRDLTLNGLPANYELRIGDMLSFLYGSNPARRALHRVVANRTASAGGQMTALSVVPLVRPGWAVGSGVTLLRPTCKAEIIPGSFEASRDLNRIATGMSFSWLQTLR